MNPKYIVALDMGSSKVRAAVAQAMPGVNGHTAIQIIALEEQPMLDAVRAGLIQNVDAAADAARDVMARLAKHPRVGGRKIETIYVGAGGRSVTATPIEVEAQLAGEEKVGDDVIDMLAEDAVRDYRLHYPSERDILDRLQCGFTIDGHPETNPRGQYTNNIGAKFSIITARPQLQRNLQRVVVESLGLNCEIVVRPLAETFMVTTAEERNLGCVVVDMGAETTTIVIYRHGYLQWLCTLPLGGRHITRDLMTTNCTEERAEALKITMCNVMPETEASPIDADVALANQYATARVAEIVANINAQIDYAGFKRQDLPSGIVLVGGAARMRGLASMLARDTKMAVRIGEPLDPIPLHIPNINLDQYVDILSILKYAASLPNAQSCLGPEPKPEPKPEPQQAPAATAPRAPYGRATGVEIDPNDPFRKQADDDQMLIDEYELEQQRQRKADKDRRDEDRLKGKEEKRRRDEEKRLRDEEEKRRRAEEKAKRGPSMWEKLQKKVTEFVASDKTDEDEDE